jgi:hypothetical protein
MHAELGEHGLQMAAHGCLGHPEPFHHGRGVEALDQHEQALPLAAGELGGKAAAGFGLH